MEPGLYALGVEDMGAAQLVKSLRGVERLQAHRAHGEDAPFTSLLQCLLSGWGIDDGEA